MKIWKSKAGIIGEGVSWCCYSGGYLYIHDTFPLLMWQMVSEWKNDRHLVG